MAHLSLVTLAVADLARATRFYETLRWRRSTASGPTVTFFHGDTAALALFGRDNMAADAGLAVTGASAPSAASPEVSLAMNVATEAEVDEAVALAEGAGGHVSQPPRKTDWGGYAGSFLDPDGHLWEVAHNPFFPLRADGGVELPDE